MLAFSSFLCLFYMSPALSQSQDNERFESNKLTVALMAAQTDEQRTALLAANTKLVTSELGQELLNRGYRLYQASKYLEALRAYNSSLRIAEMLAHREGISIALSNIGDTYESLGEYDHALEYLQRSLQIVEALHNKDGVASVLNNLGIVYKSQGEYERALACYQQSLKLSNETGNEPLANRTIINLGEVLQLQGEYQQALNYFQKSLQWAEQNQNDALRVLANNNLGSLANAMGNPARALEYYEKSLNLAEGIRSNVDIAVAMHNIGNLYRAQGEYKKALVYLLKCLALQAQSGNQADVALTLNSVGALYSAQGNFRLALDYYQKSLQLEKSIGHKAGIAATQRNIAALYYMQGNNERALSLLPESLRLYQRLNDKAGVASLLNIVGNVYFAMGKRALAQDCFQTSLSMARAIGNKAQESATLINLARVSLANGKNLDAITYSERAAAIAKENNILARYWAARYTAGLAYRARNRMEFALKAFEDAVATIEQLREQVVGGELQEQYFFGNKLAPYHALIELLISQHKFVEAFKYAELAKGRVLLDVLRNSKPDTLSYLSEQEQAAEQSYNVAIAELNAQSVSEGNKDKPDETRLQVLDSHLEQARLAHEEFLTGLYAAHPELKVRHGHVSTINLDQAAGFLPNEKSIVLEYVVLGEQTYIFALVRGGAGQTAVGAGLNLQVYPVPITSAALTKLVRTFHTQLAERRLDFGSTSEQLYQLLIKPVRQLITRSGLINTFAMLRFYAWHEEKN